MDYYRVSDTFFDNLKDYPFKPHYVDVNGLRMHYLDEGPKEANPILMLHGEPSWSYLYRHMIPVCVGAAHRVIAPDLIGFGKSDKPKKIKDYSYQAHMDQMTTFMLPTGDQETSIAFKIWQTFALFSPWFPIERIIDFGCFKKLDKEEKRAYRAPFPSSKYKAGARALPKLVPVSAHDSATDANRKAWEVLAKWHKPFLTAFSNGDPITRGGDKYMQKRIPGATGRRHVTLKGGHFLQEDAGIEFAEVINQLIKDIRKPVQKRKYTHITRRFHWIAAPYVFHDPVKSQRINLST